MIVMQLGRLIDRFHKSLTIFYFWECFELDEEGLSCKNKNKVGVKSVPGRFDESDKFLKAVFNCSYAVK